MAQTKKFQGVATSVSVTLNGVEGRYHNTVVAVSNGRTVTLNSGGYMTATTKLRMNQFSNQFCYGKFKVVQSKYCWVVEVRKEEGVVEKRKFEDGMEFSV